MVSNDYFMFLCVIFVGAQIHRYKDMQIRR